MNNKIASILRQKYKIQKYRINPKIIQENSNIVQENPTITIAYITCRSNPKIEWFFYSLNRELKGQFKNIKIIIVDYLFQFYPNERYTEFKKHYQRYENINIKHIAPLPCPVQGKYKISSQNFFAAGLARNSAFVACDTDYIVCIDDLSVIKEGWFKVIEWGCKNNYVVLGSYAKVNNLTCDEHGNYTYDLDSYSKNLDSRFNNPYIKNNFATKVSGSWLYGASFGMPCKLAMQLDGFDSICNTIGSEDSEFGIRLGRLTNEIYYSKTLFSFEDDLLHFVPENYSFKRISMVLTDKTLMHTKKGKNSDHAIIENVMESNNYLPFLPNNLIELKDKNPEEIAKNFDKSIYWVNGELISKCL